MRPVLRWTAVVVVVGIGASVGVVAFADDDDDPADRYRFATATVGDVAQTVATSGTVDFVNRADVSFGVDGTLAEVSVRQGQQVSAGQRLATLDSAGLQAAADAAEADLAEAKATLEADQRKQEESVAADSDTDTGADEPGPDETGTDGQALREQQQAVRAAQTAAGKAIAASKAALAAQTKACAEAPAPDDTQPEADGAAPDAACADALADAMSTQDAVADAQGVLQKKIDELAAAMNSAASEMDTPDGDSRDSQPDGAPTAATIATDQAAVDTAESGLRQADQALAQVTLTAPIAGTVASVGVAAGDDVSAGNPVVVLIGAGAAVVETTVPVERIGEIEVGQTATVTPSGSTAGIEGTVSRIGLLADDSAESVAYPVTITVDEPTAAMPAGSTAGVAIVIDTAEGVLTVPTSAVHNGTPSTVTVLAGAESTPREVTVGAVGPLRTEIETGLEEGERVVLADLDTPLPSADQQTGPSGRTMPPGGGPVMGGPPVRMGG
ncbi:MAG: HlyD family efflux transporter periplasmic adaptor subunit [Actinophytocola sp.]|uniref:efflux RND transporter periplasmic adaptor subunit n=1 Tax=Actinophytocola sp. TaxID=1872138 RepID=UPI001322AB7C|nr:HlyD family efflux transporter periplasmic adaptor subunit [Actinophytocola sp.]MPZ83800.1 HlyD family efflux transporter periplasmic adaptor subunit [Actinophytocola sp.]